MVKTKEALREHRITVRLNKREIDALNALSEKYSINKAEILRNAFKVMANLHDKNIKQRSR